MRQEAIIQFEYDGNLSPEWDRYCGCEDRSADSNVPDVADIPLAKALNPGFPDGLYHIVTMSAEINASIEDKDVLGVVNVAKLFGYDWVDTEQCMGLVWIESASDVDVAVGLASGIDFVAHLGRHAEETQAFRNGVRW